MYYIWSFEHQAWWGHERRGYSYSLDNAGLYNASEAGEIVTRSIFGEEVAILREVAVERGAPTVKSLWERVDGRADV